MSCARPLGLLFVLTGSLSIVGCGGSKITTMATSTTTTRPASQASGQTQTAGRPLSRSELIAKADSICTQVNYKREQTKIVKPQDYSSQLPPLAAAIGAEATELDHLTPEPSLRRQWHEVVASTRTIAADLPQLAKYAEASNTKRARALDAVMSQSQSRIAAITHRLGFKECGYLEPSSPR